MSLQLGGRAGIMWPHCRGGPSQVQLSTAKLGNQISVTRFDSTGGKAPTESSQVFVKRIGPACTEPWTHPIQLRMNCNGDCELSLKYSYWPLICGQPKKPKSKQLYFSLRLQKRFFISVWDAAVVFLLPILSSDKQLHQELCSRVL